MAESPVGTQFAPAERAGHEQIVKESHYFNSGSPISTLLNLVPDVILILNKQRQVVFANRAAIEFAAVDDMEDLLGMRPGELLHCKHSHESDNGCGTTTFCRYCGAVHAILESQDHKSAVEECRVTVEKEGHEEAVDLRVWARPLEVGEDLLTFFAITDIADEKRRQFLERIFLHDIMNTATALRGFSWLLHENEEDRESRRNYGDRISYLTERMIQEIQAHRQLLAAESGELKPQVQRVNSYVILQDTYFNYCRPELLERRLLHSSEGSAAVDMETDPTLLSRVLENMVKNAIEASVPGDVVTMGCREDGEDIIFWVHNPTYMPENIRSQIFNRSFSTKGPGRGLGTYSIKYLTEKYMGGHASFTSSEQAGTQFEVRYPRNWRGGRAN
ncbi:MAG TPA: ATP-binding protein [Terriglobales bacterium]|nr:ATP-binding protein [Terriglobales bacterium]